MKIAPTLAVLMLAASTFAAPHVSNPAMPPGGIETLTASVDWHRGHDDDAILFGAVRTVREGPGGELFVLDTQLAHVQVFGRDGDLLDTLSREGEGPGESRRPEDLVLLPDGSIGIVQYINGRIIRIARDGTPLGSLLPPDVDNEGGGMSSIRRVRARGGVLVINGASVRPDDEGGMVRSQYLSRCDDQARPVVEYLSTSTPSNLMRDGWIERNNYFPSHERWDIDAAGRVLAATERNEYLITVYEPDGAVAFTFGRDHEPWKRTEEEKQEIRDSLTVLRDGQRVEVEVDVEDHAPAIVEITVRDDGEVWVLPTSGQRDQPDGVMQTYDVFSSEGMFLRQVRLACIGDPEEDRLFLMDGGRAALVRGAVQARRNAFGGSRVEEDDVAAHDLMVLGFR